MKAHFSLILGIGCLLAAGAAQAAPNPVVQGFHLGFWNIISDFDHNANQNVTDFGNVDVGSSNDRTYRLQNTTDGVLMWEGFSSADGQFEVRTTSGAAQGFPIPIVGGDDRDFLIRFTPNTTGRSASIVTLDTNAANLGAEYTFEIEGVGQAPAAQLAGRQGGSGGYTTIGNGDTSPRLLDGTDFGFIPTGSFVERDFQLTNTGNQTLDPGSAFFVGGSASNFSIVGLTYGNLGAGNSRTFSIRFTPSNTGVKTTTLNFVSDDPDDNPYTFALRGEGVAFPNIRVRGLQGPIPTDIDDGDHNPDQQVTQYGDVLLGTPGTRTFRVVNDGNGTLQISSINSSDPAFDVSGLQAIITPNDSDDFVIKFTPNSSGVTTTIITIASNSPGDEDSYTFALSGTGVIPDARISGRQGDSGGYDGIVDGETTPRLVEGTDFGTIPIGSPVTRWFKVTNVGTADLDMNSTSFNGGSKGDFSVGGLNLGKLKPDGFDEFTITWTPTTAGQHSTTFWLVSDDPDENPYDFKLAGEAVAFPNIEVKGLTGAGIAVEIDDNDLGANQDVTDFGDVDLGQSDTRIYRIKNVGNATLTVSSVTSNNSRFTIPGPPTSVFPDKTVDFVINFTPTALNTQFATITIDSNTPGDEDPYTFAIKGTGTGPEIVVEGTDVRGAWFNINDGYTGPDPRNGTRFRDTNITGDSDRRAFRVRNTGNKNLRLNGRDFDGSGASHFSVSGLLAGNPFADIGPGNSRTFTISFNPSSAGSKLATFSIDNNDSNEDPFNFQIGGTGVAQPQIRVLGPRPETFAIPPRQEIYDGDSLPSGNDGTNFTALSIAGDSLTRTFRIENEGDGTLNISNISVDLPGEYQIVGAPSSVGGGQHEDFDIVFDPATDGHHHATVSIQSDAWEPGGLTFLQDYTFAITGYGWDNVSPVLRVSGQGTTLRTEGEFDVGLDLSFIPGYFGADLNLDIDIGSIPYTINLNPNWQSIADNDPNTRRGNGTDFGSPNIELGSPPIYNNYVNRSLFRFENLGAMPLVIDEITIDNEFYFAAGGPITIAPGDHEVIRVSFNPDIYGREDATITLHTNAPNQSLYRIRVTGFGDSSDGPEIDVPADRDFGSLADVRFRPEVGMSETQSIEIINQGNESLIASLFLDGSDQFTNESASNLVLRPGTMTTVDITFQSPDFEVYEGTLVITHNDPDGDPSPILVSLSGQTVDPTPAIDVFGAGLVPITSGSTTPITADGTHFGTASSGGTGVTHEFYIENLRDSTITLDSITTGSGSFRIESVPAEIPAGETAPFILTFLPLGAGEESGTVQMELSSPNGYLYTYEFAIGGDSTLTTPAPPKIILFDDSGGFAYLLFTSVPTETYTIETSADGAAWNPAPYHTGLSSGAPFIERYVLKPNNSAPYLLRVRQD